MAKPVIKSVKGTRDFYPREMAKRKWLYKNIQQISESFGYVEYEGPILETLDLYAAKSGEELVKEQAFVFPDKGGKLITLRPELTPTLARMVAQRQHELNFPLRWWSFGPFWRYERPQKGRTREFFQWNLDILGVGTPYTDAELIHIVTSFFKKVGLSADLVRVHVNNRRLMDSILQELQLPVNKQVVFQYIDRMDKMSVDNWHEYGIDLGLSTKNIEQLEQILRNEDLWQRSDELVKFFHLCKTLGIDKYVVYDARIIRGLDYYTGIVFEAKSVSGEFRRAILGGGRYDNLLADVGGTPLPGAGFAMGDVVISLILEEEGLYPEFNTETSADILVTTFSDDFIEESYDLASRIRENGFKVTVYPIADKLGKQFKYADSIGVKFAIILGPDELQQGTISIKDIRTREQFQIERERLISTLDGLI